MPIIYHITTETAWKTAKTLGFYECASLKTEGFIHCSQGEQISGVLQRYFTDKTNLVKLVVDTNKLTSQLIYEWSSSIADTFPHIYGPINLEAVEEALPV